MNSINKLNIMKIPIYGRTDKIYCEPEDDQVPRITSSRAKG